MPGDVQPYPSPADTQDAEDAKDWLRRGIRAARSERSARRREQAAQAIADVLETIPEVRQARCASVYSATEGEPGTAEVLNRMSARGVRILLPVLGAGLQREWAEYRGADDLLQRSPGRPLEPGGPELGAHALADADVIIVPALAVDTSGARLGQGGGWYDRALEHARPDVMVVALTFPEEIYEAGVRPLPHEAHDHPIDAVATPEGWQRLRRPAAA